MTWRMVNVKSIEDSRGRLSVVEHSELVPPADILASEGAQRFRIQRVYWINVADERVDRGGHAHRKTHQVFFCLSGNSLWSLEDGNGVAYMPLGPEAPGMGLYVPPMVWHTMSLEPGTVILALASEHHDETDYIRSFTEWRALVPETRQPQPLRT